MGCRMARRLCATTLTFLLVLATLPSLASAGEQSAPLGEGPGLLSALWEAVLDLWEAGMNPTPNNSGDLGPGLDPAG